MAVTECAEPARTRLLPRRGAARVAGVALVVLLSGCGGDGFGWRQADDTPASPQAAGPAEAAGSADASGSAEASPAPRPPQARHVVAVSIDGLTPAAMSELGTAGASVLWRLVTEGASTLDARTSLERTVTLPNHTGMLTGRRVVAERGGHGVTMNYDPGGTIADLAGEPVSSVFDVVHAHDGETALFASKSKFELFQRSWPAALDRFEVIEDNTVMADGAAAAFATDPATFTFVHFSLPDQTGHEHGWMGAEYLNAVRTVDELLGRLVASVESDARVARRTLLIVTADHGGSGNTHADRLREEDYTVPFVVWGAGVPRGLDLYDLNPRLADPGDGRPGYRGRQPLRNGDLANVALTALGLPAVPGSEFDAAQRIVIRAPR
ncbi:alkaline phosphatase family protein [Nocardioides ferulae]|uniref:alkaline phosphatase family protein n=1 Tax=Nocardioides ferulae TaxID=2340821 RepID=UPI000EB362F7|nr:alkaline phosphatase [Nocardioides ferulae]